MTSDKYKFGFQNLPVANIPSIQFLHLPILVFKNVIVANAF